MSNSISDYEDAIVLSVITLFGGAYSFVGLSLSFSNISQGYLIGGSVSLILSLMFCVLTMASTFQSVREWHGLITESDS